MLEHHRLMPRWARLIYIANDPGSTLMRRRITSDMGSILSRGQGEAAGRNRRCGPPLRCGQVEFAGGVERVDADALSSLTCAGWLPQDRGFEVGVGPLV